MGLKCIYFTVYYISRCLKTFLFNILTHLFVYLFFKYYWLYTDVLILKETFPIMIVNIYLFIYSIFLLQIFPHLHSTHYWNLYVYIILYNNEYITALTFWLNADWDVGSFAVATEHGVYAIHASFERLVQEQIGHPSMDRTW